MFLAVNVVRVARDRHSYAQEYPLFRIDGFPTGRTMRAPNPADLQRAALIFKGLSHPHRIQLACSLANGRAATQKQLLEELHWPQSTMARHLGALRERGLIKGTRSGNRVVLQLDGTVTPQLLHAVCEWVHPETGEHMASTFSEDAGDTHETP